MPPGLKDALTTLPIMLSGAGAVVLFLLVGFQLFSSGWQSYEERYVQGAGRTLDAMYLTMPLQHLVYLSFASSAVIGIFSGFIFGSVAWGTILAVVGFVLPTIAVRLLKKRRDAKFRTQLVDALMNVSNSLRAGFSLHQAFDMIQREMPNPISQEFRLVNQQLRFGLSMEETLNNLHGRMPSEDLDLVATAIVISRDVGGNLTEVFDNIADTIRSRHRLHGKIRALTAQGKWQAGLICSLPPLLGIAINAVNPALMEPVYHTIYGWGMIAIIVVLQLLGIFTIMKIVDIDV
ncbi:MAG: type II secretion system F family protein [Planctomycetota bacterium]